MCEGWDSWFDGRIERVWPAYSLGFSLPQAGLRCGVASVVYFGVFNMEACVCLTEHKGVTVRYNDANYPHCYKWKTLLPYGVAFPPHPAFANTYHFSSKPKTEFADWILPRSRQQSLFLFHFHGCCCRNLT